MTAKPPPDPAGHAADFAARYAEPMDYHVAQRMLDLGIPPEEVGSGDGGQGIRHTAFMAHERTGGGNVPGKRLTVDSGVFNPELFKDLGPEVSSSWAKSRLKDRLDAIIAHEYTEAATGGHMDAVRDSADTRLPIREGARRLLRTIAEGGLSR